MGLRYCVALHYKKGRSIDLLGCSYLDYKNYLELKFTEGMTWEKFLKGEIHIDHILPLSMFDLTDQSQQQIAFNFKNTQPLWLADNLAKSDNIIPFAEEAA